MFSSKAVVHVTTIIATLRKTAFLLRVISLLGGRMSAMAVHGEFSDLRSIHRIGLETVFRLESGAAARHFASTLSPSAGLKQSALHADQEGDL